LEGVPVFLTTEAVLGAPLTEDTPTRRNPYNEMVSSRLKNIIMRFAKPFFFFTHLSPTPISV
jgi:hypothetical protein